MSTVTSGAAQHGAGVPSCIHGRVAQSRGSEVAPQESRHVASCRVASRHVTSCLVPSHHVALRHITSRQHGGRQTMVHAILDSTFGNRNFSHCVAVVDEEVRSVCETQQGETETDLSDAAVRSDATRGLSATIP